MIPSYQQCVKLEKLKSSFGCLKSSCDRLAVCTLSGRSAGFDHHAWRGTPSLQVLSHFISSPGVNKSIHVWLALLAFLYRFESLGEAI